jgi:hypothetical protein
MIYLIVRLGFLINSIIGNFLGETKEECQKYGEVDKCLIYEVCTIKKGIYC